MTDKDSFEQEPDDELAQFLLDQQSQPKPNPQVNTQGKNFLARLFKRP